MRRGAVYEKPQLWARITDRFRIRGTEAEAVKEPVVNPDINLVVDVDKVSMTYRVVHDATTVTIPAGSSTQIEVFNVPWGWRREIVAISIYRASGDNTLAQVSIFDRSEGTQMPLHVAANFYTWHEILPQLVGLESRDGLLLVPDGAGVAETVFDVRMQVREYQSLE